MDYKVKLKNIKESCVLTKIPADAQTFLTTEIIKNFSDADTLFIAQNDAEMESVQRQIQFFAPDTQILIFPAWDSLPYDRASPKHAILSQRIKTLYRLVTRKEGQKFFVIAAINAVLQKTIQPNQIKDLGLYLQVGSKISITQIADILVSKGYERQACANNVGEFAVRGGIVDLVMQQAVDLIGYRIDFFGDEVESIKIFDPLTQMTHEAVKSLEILPASEVIMTKKSVENFRQKYRTNFGAAIDDQLYSAISEMRSYSGMENWLPFFFEEDLSSFFDYLNNPTIFFSDKIFDCAKHRDELVNEYYQARINEKKINDGNIYNPIAPELLYFSAQDLREKLAKNLTIQFNQFDESDKNQRILDLEIKPIPDFALAGKTNQRDPLELVKEYTSGKKFVIACLTESFKDRISKLLPDYNIKCPTIVLPLHFGFETRDSMMIGEQAIFGEKIVRKKSSKAASQRLIEEGLSIQVGELVVHRDHGIGRFQGIQTIAAGNIKTDMIKIEYGGNDTLFVPVDDIGLITRYGSDNPLIHLDRLGVAAWKNRRDKVRKRIKVAAEELLKIAAARHLKKAPIFTAEEHFYDEFKAKFGFVETEDQMRAIEEVEEDLAKGSPMDRLICGDVGFGKTEVALRAAAIVVGANQPSVERSRNPISSSSKPLQQEASRGFDHAQPTGYQVAVVAPTTLLSRQHFKNFSKRFEGTGIKIVQLSRLVTPTKAKEIRTKIASGEAQIVIGTHAILQKSVEFKNLGLVIIDEEQHFGVAQKERLKELRHEVHVLTLSATPIPRTLQMSMTGVKDLSLISTPPLDRLAVRNFVMPYDSVIVREAVMREHNRSGRVFFVVPRIRDLEEIEPRLKILLPEIKITSAHGQMPPNKLDQIMNDFVDGKIDMLLSTTIIESGIDISEANTMIIYKSEMFGLSQLYQLRGRVGRGKMRAYCYFMLDNRKKVSDESRKKLEVMQNLDSLGVGFTVATHDMDIRGSGNLLGDEQSGHINETGVELYQQMLLETIDELKNKTHNSSNEILRYAQDDNLTHDFNVQIKLGISLLIPEDYIQDLALRMSFYKKIATIKSTEDEDELSNEMTDRFGKLPEEIKNLMEVARLKSSCRKVGVEKLEAISDGILVSFKDNKFANPDALLKMVFSSKNLIKIHQGQKVLFVCDVKSQQIKISAAARVIEQLTKIL